MIDPAKILAGLPSGLRMPLLESYGKIVSNYAEHRWEPSELNGGKLCETVYCIVQGALTGAFLSKPSKPSNMVEACKALEKTSADPTRIGDRSLRILIPRMLPALYEIRNNRGVGHVGGDVDPNFLDATAVYGMASWLLAELIRIFHGVTTKEAQETVDALSERKTPLIWEVEEIRRVLDASMKPRDQVLLLLHSRPAWTPEGELLKSVEYASASMFRTRILRPLHKARFIEYDQKQSRARISPLGSAEVEARILRPRAS